MAQVQHNMWVTHYRQAVPHRQNFFSAETRTLR
jgi:hypothetical protein